MEICDIKKIIESLLFVSDKPLLNREIKAVIKDELPENVKLEDIMEELQQEYVQFDRAFELKFVADGWTFATKPEYSNWIRILLKEKTILKLSPSAMEVLAIVAYKQPITRSEIENVRGVDSSGVIDTLTDRKFIKIVGRKETLGRPLLYGTTQEFLRHFGLSHLSDLPVIENAKDVLPDREEDIQELSFENQQDNFKQNDNVVNEEKAEINENFIDENAADIEDNNTVEQENINLQQNADVQSNKDIEDKVVVQQDIGNKQNNTEN